MHILTTVKNLFRLKTDDSTNDDAQPPPYDHDLKSKRDERSDAESTKPVFKLPEPRTMAYYGLTDNDFRRPKNLHTEAPSTNQKAAGAPLQAFYGSPKFYGKVTTVNIRRDPDDPANCDEVYFSMEDHSQSPKAA